MIITLLIFLLSSNAVSLKQDKSIYFGRITIASLISVSYLSLNNLYFAPLEKGIALYGGLFHVTTFTQSFNFFIPLISALILSLNSFYPHSLTFKDNPNIKLENLSFSSLYNLLTFKREDHLKVNNYKFNSDLFVNNLYPNNLEVKSEVSYERLLNKSQSDNNPSYNKLDKDLILSRRDGQFRIIEYPLIVVFVICGGLFLISTNDLVSMFLSIELQSYALYILSTLYRDSESATASGLTYFLLGGLSSCFILLGSALLYINSGTTSLENIYVIASLSEVTMSSSWYQPYFLHLSLIIMCVGFLFKVSAAPFHFWSPDVYDGIPTIVTTFVAIIAKISIFAFFLELVYYTDHAIFEFTWKNILLLSSLLSLVIGSVLGLSQFRIKRLYAYSTINHVGFILLALSINSTESISSYIFYILQYSLANLNAFFTLIIIGYTIYKGIDSNDNATSKKTNIDFFAALSIMGKARIGEQEKGNHLSTNSDNHLKNDYLINDTRNKKIEENSDKNKNNKENNLVDENNSPIQLLKQIKGYFYINPFISISLAITLFSFAGIPPLIGFFAKQMILSAALDSGYVFMALVAIITSVISAAYYLNLIKEIFFYSPSTNSVFLSREQKNNTLNLNEENKKNIRLNSSLTSLTSILTLILVLFIYIPETWFNTVNILSLIMFKA